MLASASDVKDANVNLAAAAAAAADGRKVLRNQTHNCSHNFACTVQRSYNVTTVAVRGQLIASSTNGNLHASFHELENRERGGGRKWVIKVMKAEVEK